jgi:hypothetical protein
MRREAVRPDSSGRPRCDAERTSGPGSLVTVTSPPIMRASLRVMARPSPVPPKRCAVVEACGPPVDDPFAAPSFAS